MKVRIPNQGNQMAEMLKQAQKVQEDMAAKQAELEEREYEVSAGGGVVTVRMSGKHEVRAIEIAPELVDPDDIETLEDILVAAVNEAVHKVDETASAEMEKITGMMPAMPGGIPGLM